MRSLQEEWPYNSHYARCSRPTVPAGEPHSYCPRELFPCDSHPFHCSENTQSCWRQPGVCCFLIAYPRSRYTKMSVSPLYCVRIQDLPSPRPRAESTHPPDSAACLLVLPCPFYRKKSWASIKTPSEPAKPHCCWRPGTTKHHLPEGTWQVFKSGCTKH